MKCQCVADHPDQLPVAMMCRLLEILPGGFYAWLRRPESNRSNENRHYGKRIVEIHAESDEVYRSRKVRDELLDLGFTAARHQIARLMRELGLKGCPRSAIESPRNPITAIVSRPIT